MTETAVRPSSADAAGARLGVFRLVPTARRDDRRFARDAFHGELVVRAYSADDARAVAREAEAAALAVEPPERSPFGNPALYTVIEVAGVDFLRGGKRGVITGRFNPRADRG